MPSAAQASVGKQFGRRDRTLAASSVPPYFYHFCHSDFLLPFFLIFLQDRQDTSWRPIPATILPLLS
jgi:hypothetical protein